MNDLFMFAAHNTVIALVLASFVHGLTRVWRNPPVAHILWLLVLLKLAAPPFIRVDWSTLPLPESAHTRGQMIAGMSQIEGEKAEGDPRFVSGTTPRTTARATAMSVNEHEFGARLRLLWNRGRPFLFWSWLGGAVLCALVAASRIVRFERVLRDTLPASERLRQLASEIAAKLGVRRVPDLRYAGCALGPLLWCAGRRAKIVLPIGLLRDLDDRQVAMILAHELAHLRRRDHWVRAIELIVSTIYWWNPLVWFIRRRIHHAEDLCCDAWVRWTYPDCAKRYAEVVLKTAAALNTSRVGPWLLPASPFLHSLSLKARIEMILESRLAPSISTRSMFAIALFALLVLPSFVPTTAAEAWAGANDEAQPPPARKSDTPTTSEFPYILKFEQGATRFLDGDTITILEVRGTADAMTPGNIYWIKGTYMLASHDSAVLAAYTTATDARNGTGPSLKVQTTVVHRGNGAFTLFLPMSSKGWPHVSFYPAGGGEAFGGNYFGTGDSVLKRWWHTGETPVNPAAKPDNATASEFPHVLKFERGATRFQDRDKITILEVRGTADTMTPGNTYCIKGTYTLASHDRATLAAFTTAREARNGTGASRKTQTTVVNRGNGDFTLVLPMSYEGWPHVSFYPVDGGEAFGGIYFGTGDAVLKTWWKTH